MSQNRHSGPVRFGFLLLGSSIGVFCGSEVRYVTMLMTGSSGRVRSLAEHVDVLVNSPLLLPALLFTPASAVVALGTSVVAWRLSGRRMRVAVIVAASGCCVAAYLNLLALTVQ